VAAAVLLCWGPGLGAFFFADDFVLLEGSLSAWNRAAGWGEWLRTVFLKPGIMDGNYRPFSTHICFLVMQRSFGLAPLAFHGFALALHFATALGIGALAERLGASRRAALLAALFYATRDALFGSVAWAAGIQDGLMTAFGVASMLALTERIKSGRRAWTAISLALMASSLLSKEMGLALAGAAPAVACAAFPTPQTSRWRQAARAAWPHWALCAAFILLRFLIVRNVTVGKYQMGLGPAPLWRPGAYAFWTCLGWAPSTLSQFWLFRLCCFTGWLLIVIAAVDALAAFRHKGAAASHALIVVGLLWWGAGVGLLMLLSIRFHMYYLSLPAAGAALALAGFVDRWLPAGPLAPRLRLAVACVALAAVLVGARMTEFKRKGFIASGGYYHPLLAEMHRNLCGVIERTAPGLNGWKRVVLINYVDWLSVLADVDGKGYRTTSTLASMLRAIFNRPDIETLYATTPQTELPPAELTPGNIVPAETHLGTSRRDGDLILSFDEKTSAFSLWASQ